MTAFRSAAEFLSRDLASLDAEVPGLLMRVHRQSDPEAIHDLRVAIRRLRTLLRLARPIYGRHHTDLIRAVYTQAGRASGDLRDEEVFLELLDKAKREVPEDLAAELATFRASRVAHERELRGRAMHSLETAEISRARGMLSALLALPVRPKKDRDLPRFARQAVLKALGTVDELRDASHDDVHGLHDLRIAYKRLRYTLEFFKSALPPDLMAMHESAVRFQKRLGEIHDVDMALARIGSHAEGSALSPELRRVLKAFFEDSRRKKLAAYENALAGTSPAP